MFTATPKSFYPTMLEPCYKPDATRNPLLENMVNSLSHLTSATPDDDETRFKNTIMSELRGLYNAEPVVVDSSGSASPTILESCQEINSRGGFSSLEELKSHIQLTKDACLDKHCDRIEQMRQSATDIISSVCNYLRHTEKDLPVDDLIKLMNGELLKHVFLSPSYIRRKLLSTNNKPYECMLQILLRMEWVSYKMKLLRNNELEQDASDAEDISQFLRVISLTHSVEKMRDFLHKALVQFYASTMGNLLCEVHGDLMIPLPKVLQEFSMDDSVFESLSSMKSEEATSTDPFSVLSSVGSHSSVDSSCFFFNRKRHSKASQLKPSVTRQIVVPRTRNQLFERKASRVSMSESRHRNSSSTADSKNVNINTRSHCTNRCNATSAVSVAEEVVRVRRDLFASPSKRRRRTTSKSRSHSTAKAPVKKGNQSKRGCSVQDTPAGKQRLTALARQRWRMKKISQAQQKEEDAVIVIEESPLKLCNTSLKPTYTSGRERRSPRHAIMLTRRHSFYRDGSDSQSRTVARARVVHQHKQAVPPTPRILPAFRGGGHEKKAGLISPKSLLFSNTGANRQEKKLDGSGTNQCVTSGRSRRKLHLLANAPPADEQNPSPAEGVQNQTTPNVFSERKNAAAHPLLSLACVSAKIDAFSDNIVNQAVSDDSLQSPPEQSEAPFQAYHEALDSTSVCGERKQTETLESSSTAPGLSPSNGVVPKQDDLERTPYSKEKVKSADVTPTSCATVRRSLRLACQNAATDDLKSPSCKKMGPLDQFVIRTPTPGKPNRSSHTPPKSKSKRKPSPIGDHIKKWPKKKRFSENLSPAFPKRRKKTQSLDSDLTVLRSCSDSHHHASSVTTPYSQPVRSLTCIGSDHERISPGIEVDQLCNKTIVNTVVLKTPKKTRSPDDFLADMGVFPITGKESLPGFRRWTSPRRKPTSHGSA